MKSERGHVRSFATPKNELDKTVVRSNERYDLLIKLKEKNEREMDSIKNQGKKQKKELEKKHKESEKGLMGFCVLRSLSNFDVGTSFMADSLHNVYSGGFVSRKTIAEKPSFISSLETTAEVMVR